MASRPTKKESVLIHHAMRKTVKVVMYIIGGIITIFLGLILVLWILSPGKADPITDASGKAVEGSISTIEKISLGGVEQYLVIRGQDATKPVMLFLHGGPGSPQVAFMKHFNTDIEKDFVMVYWEQRGAGKSYSKNVPNESMSLEQFVSDTRELSEYLSQKFNQDRIFIMGHSWGSLLGIMTAYQYPELFHAYFGIGQVADQFRGEKVGLEWVVEQAQKNQDKKAIKALGKLNFPDSLADNKAWLDYMTTQRLYVNKYGGGTTREIRGMLPLVSIVFKAKEYTLRDKLNYMRGNMFSLRKMWDEVIHTNLFNQIDSMQVSVYIFHGKYDYTTPYCVSKDFYHQLKVQEKAFFTFENSAHSPLKEEVEKFNSIVREITQKY
ncbi:MAG: alpha/beta hydrolase [Bacteroidetes bacterium]|nr:MAG: alpha/beta hydrolase [Bacteroidota bacterium]